MGLFQDIRDVLKALSRRRPGRSFCPKCGGSDISLSSGFDYWLTPRKYLCRECGYSGPVVLEVEED